MQRLRQSVIEAARLEVTIAHFASLQQLKTLPPTACFIAPVWYTTRDEQPLHLFPARSEELQHVG